MKLEKDFWFFGDTKMPLENRLKIGCKILTVVGG
jgi:hypothetical protein